MQKIKSQEILALKSPYSYITGAVDAGPAETEALFNDWVAEVILNEVGSC